MLFFSLFSSANVTFPLCAVHARAKYTGGSTGLSDFKQPLGDDVAICQGGLNDVEVSYNRGGDTPGLFKDGFGGYHITMKAANDISI
jgi:hypothetical protein